MEHHDDAQGADAADAHRAVPARTLGKMVNMAGAVVSVALVVGIGLWGYKLIMRDVSGVPVVRAVEGPMRMQPKNPGGQRADHQGLAVNQVAAQGAAAPTADTLHLAPRPVDLAEEDAPMPDIQPVAEAQAEPEPEPAPEPDSVASTETDEVEPTDAPETSAVAAFQPGSIDALVAEVTRDMARENEGVAALDPGIEDEDISTEPAVEIVSGPGVARSMRPLRRPASLVVTASAPAAPLAPRETPEVAPDTVAVGTALAQIGALESADAARREWDRLAARFEDYLGDKTRVIQQASSGGRSFYRLRAMGFADIADARRFCAVLVSEKTDCVPVIVK